MVRYVRVLRFNEICELKAILARCKELINVVELEVGLVLCVDGFGYKLV